MVSLDKLHSLSNLKLTALMHIVHSCMIIMVVCESDSDWDEKDFYQNKVTDSKKITTIKDLKEKIELDERSVLSFPVQEDGYVKRINIPARISHNHCRTFGILLLGLDRILDTKVPVEESQDLSCETILLKWLKMGGTNYDEPITFRTLINVIYKLGKVVENDYNELANKIKLTVEYYNTIDIDYVPVLVRKYSTKLSERYQKESVVDNFQWIPKMLDREIEFVDLELKEENNHNLTLDDVLYDIQGGTRVLFTGRPGVGKTTITRYLSKHIHKFKHFSLVIKLHLGALSDPIDNLGTLLEVHGKSFLSFDIASISDFIQQTNGKNICFLFDGYDEYILSRHGNYIKHIILGNELTDSVVIVTSRPNAVKEIKNLFQRKSEIIGFAESKINAYVRQLQLSNTQNETIYQYLDNHPNIRQMCYLPLHLSMLVYMIIASDGDSLALVNTETELYYNFLALTIKHYENVRHQRAVESLKECFSNSDTQTDLCDILRSISEIAFNGIRNRTQMFTSSSLIRLSGISNISAEIETLSLFRIEPAYNKDGTEFFKYSYSHPTFQEFLAAFHLTALPKELQSSYLNCAYSTWLHEVYKYYFGLIRIMSKYDDEDSKKMLAIFAKRNYYKECRINRFTTIYLMKLAYEAGHNSQYINYLKVMGIISQRNSMHVYLDEHDIHNCRYLVYVMLKIPVHELTFPISSKIFDITSCINYLKNNAKNPNVKKLVIEQKCSFEEIVKFVSIFQKNLHFLELFYEFVQIDHFLQLGKILKSFSMLQNLTLTVDVNITEGDHLRSILQNLTHLRHLKLVLLNSKNDAISNNLLEFRNLTQLQSLDLDFFNLGNVSAAAQLSPLKYLTNLQILLIRMHSNQFDTNKLLRIQDVHHSIKKLTLDLYICASVLDNRLSRTTNIKEVSKVLNNLKLQSLSVNLSLNIDFKCITTEDHVDMIELADGLGNLTELQALSLHLKWSIVLNSTVDKSAEALINRLKYLHNLHTLKLTLEYKESCKHLMTHFPSLIHLQSLDLKCKGPSNDMNGFSHQLIKPALPEDAKLYDDNQKLVIQLLSSVNDFRILDLPMFAIYEIESAISVSEAMKEIKNFFTHFSYPFVYLGMYDTKINIVDLSHNFIGLIMDVKSLPNEMNEINNLHTLNLSDSFIKDKNIKQLSELLKKINTTHTVDLSHNVMGVEDMTPIFKALKNINDLHTVDLSHNQIMGDNMKPLFEVLKEMNNLHTLDLSSNVIGYFTTETLCEEVFFEINSLHILYLSDNKLTDYCMKQLIRVLKIMKNLHTLDISHNDIRDDGMKLLAEVLLEINSLNAFDLSHNYIGLNDMKTFTEVVLQKRDNLHILDLSENLIGDDDMKLLTEILKVINDLHTLDLSHNEIGDDGMKLLNEAVEKMKILSTLDLSHNYIGDDSMKPFTEALKELNLFTLDLSHNEIGDNGIKQLTETLEKMENLSILDLSHNHIGDDCMKPLTEVLQKMNNLHTLDLSHNEVGDDGIKLLTELFDHPQQYLSNLQVLKLHSNKYSKVNIKNLAEKLKKLSQLHALEFNFDTSFDAEIKSQSHQPKVVETPVALFQYIYTISAIILGLVILIRASCFDLRTISKKIFRAFTFSVSTAWNFRRPVNLKGT